MLVGTAMSDPRPVYCGVPQGSVLGAVLLCMYTTPLEDIVLCHGVQYMLYADDIHQYITCDCDMVLTDTIKECVTMTHNWMRTNMLTLNDK